MNLLKKISTNVMNKIKEAFSFLGRSIARLNNISLPAMILLGSITLGGFYYASQVNKQRSIERQQQLELQAKSQQDQRDYIAKRKSDCLAIYKAESDKWDNVNEWRYDEKDDRCYVAYKETNPKSDAQCEKSFEDRKAIYSPKPVPLSNVYDYFLCKDGIFEKAF